jgi:hypothetical protein
MSEPIRDVVRDAMRVSRNNALDATIELGEAIAKEGGCIMCFIEQLKKLRREVRNDDRGIDEATHRRMSLNS